MKKIVRILSISLFIAALAASGSRFHPRAIAAPPDSRNIAQPGNTQNDLSAVQKPPGVKPIIQLVPLGKVKKEHIDLLVRTIDEIYAVEVLIVPRSEFPAAAYVRAGKRWMADPVLELLDRMKPPQALKMIGLTDEDLCAATEKSPTWGILGIGMLNGSSCVVSTWRLGARFNNPRMPELLSKVVAHELGHTFNLLHCPDRSCVMQDASGTIRSLDHEKAFCPACQRTLGALLRPDSAYAHWSENQ